MVEKILSASSIVIKTALEYSQLASRQEISEDEADRIEYILIEASNDPVLNFWINEIDHCLGHRLDLLNEETGTQHANQLLLLQKHLEAFLEKLDVSLASGKLKTETEAYHFLKRVSKDSVSLSSDTVLKLLKKQTNSPS